MAVLWRFTTRAERERRRHNLRAVLAVRWPVLALMALYWLGMCLWAAKVDGWHAKLRDPVAHGVLAIAMVGVAAFFLAVANVASLRAAVLAPERSGDYEGDVFQMFGWGFLALGLIAFMASRKFA